MKTLIDLSNKRLRNTPVSFTRYILQEIDWSDRVTSILGGRARAKPP